MARDDQLVAKPASWTFEQAAAVPESGCVALQAVRDRGAVRPGQHVAVIGAGGGVGSYAVQIAKSLRAVVTGVCSHAMAGGVLALGADQVFDYATSSFERQRDRYDVIIDTAGKTPLRSLRRALTTTGRLVIVGADHGHRLTGGLDRWARAILWSLFIQQDLRPFVAEPVGKERLEDLAALMQGGELVPVVDRTFRSVGSPKRCGISITAHDRGRPSSRSSCRGISRGRRRERPTRQR